MSETDDTQPDSNSGEQLTGGLMAVLSQEPILDTILEIETAFKHSTPDSDIRRKMVAIGMLSRISGAQIPDRLDAETANYVYHALNNIQVAARDTIESDGDVTAYERLGESIQQAVNGYPEGSTPIPEDDEPADPPREIDPEIPLSEL